ncbi:hypothetical protein B0H15DRAFT_61027 [Mycena belliarum]|uniref:F-box domain-containing protein n=1 Tax=Mycena belliarum TaxID=1033014 RepID=A0AAD6XIQ1_9AGAR|nr:hypothetical protein B0H15DRAFT_61027 [Mycena belliae]
MHLSLAASPSCPNSNASDMGPGLEALVSNNEPLTDTQTLHVQQTLQAALTAVSDIEGEISRTIRRLVELEAERRRRSDYTVALKGVLSPIRRIPTEILGEIFLWCRNSSLSTYNYSIVDPRQAPVLLGHISSRWRQVSQNTPSLWDHLHYHSSTSPGSQNQALSLLRPIISRSRGLALDVALDSGDGPVNDIMDLVLQEHNRLKNVSLSITDHDPPLQNKRLTFPNLLLLSISGAQEDYIDVSQFLDFFNEAPKMRTLQLISVESPSRSMVSALRLPGLTQLYLDIPLDCGQARNLLMQCDMIEECHFLDLFESGQIHPPHHVCQLNHLRTLHISIQDSIENSHPEGLFEAFALPQLDDLQIDTTDCPWPGGILASLYDRSQFLLTRLWLRIRNVDLYASAEPLVALLRHLPGLRELGLAYCGIGDELFDAFTYSPWAPLELSLPHLEWLHLEDDDNDLDGLALAEMVESVYAYSGAENAAFPALNKVDLNLGGARFSDEVEARVAVACAGSRVIKVHRNRA